MQIPQVINILPMKQGISGLFLIICSLAELLFNVSLDRSQLVKERQEDMGVTATRRIEIVEPRLKVDRGGVRGLGNRKEAHNQRYDLEKGF